MPSNIWPLIQHFLSQVIIIWDLLHFFKTRYKFWNSIIDTPNFKSRVDKDSPEGIKDCKSSEKRCCWSSILSSIMSTKFYVCISLGNLSNSI